MESLGDEQPGYIKGTGKGKNKQGTKKPSKPNANFAPKANAKVKSGRTTLTEARYWIRIIQDQDKLEDGKRKV